MGTPGTLAEQKPDNGGYKAAATRWLGGGAETQNKRPHPTGWGLRIRRELPPAEVPAQERGVPAPPGSPARAPVPGRGAPVTCGWANQWGLWLSARAAAVPGAPRGTHAQTRLLRRTRSKQVGPAAQKAPGTYREELKD